MIKCCHFHYVYYVYRLILRVAELSSAYCRGLHNSPSLSCLGNINCPALSLGVRLSQDLQTAHHVMSFIFILTKPFGVLIFPLICQSNFSHLFFFKETHPLPLAATTFQSFSCSSDATTLSVPPEFQSAFCGSPHIHSKAAECEPAATNLS